MIRNCFVLMFILFGAVFVLENNSVFAQAGADFKNISAQELNDMLKHKDFILMDVHVPEQKHLKGTDDFIPFDKIKENTDKLPPKNEKIVLYCRTGRMSALAAQELSGMGYKNVYNLKEGVEGWQKAGFPVDGPDKIIYMYAKRFTFSPDIIRARQGEKIKIIAESLDVPHGFAIEPGKKTVIEFTADKKGEHVFRCSVYCGIGHSRMKGKLVVE